MVVTVPALKAHIEKLNRGILNFSDVELNNRADLVRFEGYSIEDAATMAMDRVYDILEGDDSAPFNTSIPVEIPCECGHHEQMETDYSDWDDCYTLVCPKCKKETRLHYTAYDAIREGIEFNKSKNDEVKKIQSDYSYVTLTREVTETQLKKNGRLIQEFDCTDTAYYAMNGKYYTLDTLHKSVHVFCK